MSRDRLLQIAPLRPLGADVQGEKLDVRGTPVKLGLGPDARALGREQIVDRLWEIQQQKGWIDDASLAEAAAKCGLSSAEADEVATFYNLLFRRPVGKRVIFVCDSISCDLMGAPALLAALEAELGITLGETTSDGEYTLLPIVCLGHCEKAPCVLAGETVYGPLGTDRAAITTLVQKIRDDRAAARG